MFLSYSQAFDPAISHAVSFAGRETAQISLPSPRRALLPLQVFAGAAFSSCMFYALK